MTVFIGATETSLLYGGRRPLRTEQDPRSSGLQATVRALTRTRPP
jgi:hypothetical protein